MQYFRFLPDPPKLRKEARWSGLVSIPGIGEHIQLSADVGAGTVTAYFVDNGHFGVLVRPDIYPDSDSLDFHLLGHELVCLPVSEECNRNEYRHDPGDCANDYWLHERRLNTKKALNCEPTNPTSAPAKTAARTHR
jgi:hypothetical protein